MGGKLGTETVSRDELVGREPEGSKLVARRDLAPLATALRAGGKRIVTINGSFDLLHAGHIHILREASRQGDVLIGGLKSDRSVRSYKGSGRPFVPQTQRAELLLALRYVSYVHLFDEPVPMPFFGEIRPDVHVNGAEYGEDCVEAPLVRISAGGFTSSLGSADCRRANSFARSLPRPKSRPPCKRRAIYRDTPAGTVWAHCRSTAASTISVVMRPCS